MNTKAVFVTAAIAVAVCVGTIMVGLRHSASSIAEAAARHEGEVATLQARVNALEQKLEAAEGEREKFRADAAEVHKLRGELSTLRKTNEALEKSAAGHKHANGPVKVAPAAGEQVGIPASFSNYGEMAHFAAGLREKARRGALTPEELAWTQRMKPELDKLEANPENFAAFQASFIQASVGITDPQKAEQIRQTIHRVYENAVSRGLNIESRPEDDAAWVQQRHQLDRRGTTAIHNLLDENERAAFDRSFLGIMGVDLGTGVDKSLYPPGFLGARAP